jgi:hypothetical protein
VRADGDPAGIVKEGVREYDCGTAMVGGREALEGARRIHAG